MAEQAQQRNSPIDFANRGLQMAQNVRNAQKVVSAIQKTKKVQAAVTLIAANWEIIVVGILIAVIVILFLTIISAIVGQGNSNGGEPTLPSAQPGPPPVVGSNNILSWGEQILNYLQPYPTPCGQIYMYNVMQQVITNGSYTARQKPGSACGKSGSSYYCTNLVIDAYNLAGIKNNFSQSVPTMIEQWPLSSGLTVRESSNVAGLQQGDVVFWLMSNDVSTAQHVDIIQSMDVSTDGNGTLTTIDANTNSKTNTFFVHNWSLIGKWGVGEGNTAWFGLSPR